jgi:hypothetical protein
MAATVMRGEVVLLTFNDGTRQFVQANDG